MAINVMSYVWEHSSHKGTELLLLLAIADAVNRGGYGFPGLHTLALRIRMTRRQVQRILPRLQDSGELIIRPGAGPKGTYAMQVVMNESLPLFGSPLEAGGDNMSIDKMSPHQGRQVVTPGGDKLSREGVTFLTQRGDIAMSPEPKLKEKKKGSPDSGRELSTPPARERAGPIPADFSITPEIREWARKRGYEPYLEAHLEYLKDWAPGQRKASWEATFRNCIRADWGGIRRQARLAAQRGEAPAHSLHLQWWKHDDGIKARAAELRVAKRDDEDWIVFKARVFIAAGEGPWIDERDTTTFRVVRALQARQEARA